MKDHVAELPVLVTSETSSESGHVPVLVPFREPGLPVESDAAPPPAVGFGYRPSGRADRRLKPRP